MLARMMLVPSISVKSLVSKDFTLAVVPTGINTGVVIVLWAVVRVVALA